MQAQIVKQLITGGILAGALMFGGCAMYYDAGENSPTGPSTPSDTGTGTNTGNRTMIGPLTRLFPYDHEGSFWRYYADNGNLLDIRVVDAITDEEYTYYKVVFSEENMDTTHDWFVQGPSGVEFSSALQGEYTLFLKSPVRRKNGTFSSGGCSVSYSYYPSVTVGGATYDDVVKCSYSDPILHGFDEIYFAEGLGIIALVDRGGRFDTEYGLQSYDIGDGPVILQ
jgi:hypothetical protein